MSDTREQILEQIKLQGDLVRQLKASKESKEKVSAKRACKQKRFQYVHSHTYTHARKLGAMPLYLHMYICMHCVCHV